ncbi:hypothetical protein SY2F82_07350 [Streptomyces sp. Y2F8-2]|uniref:hypothetical protein n=1 Tax=Streptomyces sp. Y2F8-2 TaxID=2759675 RepID=UPI001907A1AC|nr:hypothetical protein [Streptomyces sp. Y2F8-2]GHJ98937.1 hypothetical protein SY2F82_07350 [Streptomyces sp. Y2F8-2]
MSVLPSEPSVSPEAAPTRRLGLYDTWWTVGAAALAVCLAFSACTWISLHLRVDATLHTVALFAHLASLVLGFGAVLVADYHALLYLTGRCTLRDALNSTAHLHLLIWSGLAGLVASGVMLHPNLGSALTRIKLGLVLVLTLNGLQAGLLNRRMKQQGSAVVTPSLLAWGAATALVSQACWWGAVAIGFRNSQY